MQIDRPIAIAVILFVILLLSFFLVVPEYRTFKELQLELGKKKAEYNAEYEYYSEIIKSYNDMQTRKEDIEKINDALPVESNFGSLVYYFQGRASESGLTFKNLFLSKSSKASSQSGADGSSKSKINDIVFSLNLLGSYSSLENFISSLEKSARLFEITSISFGSQSSSSFGSAQETQFQTQQTYNFNLEVLTHLYQ